MCCGWKASWAMKAILASRVRLGEVVLVCDLSLTETWERVTGDGMSEVRSWSEVRGSVNSLSRRS